MTSKRCYIGIGRDNRVYQHNMYGINHPNPKLKAIYSELISNGYRELKIEFIITNIEKSEALKIETKLIRESKEYANISKTNTHRKKMRQIRKESYQLRKTQVIINYAKNNPESFIAKRISNGETPLNIYRSIKYPVNS